ncbi:MAG: DUF2892 domain-containing protein [Bacteroidia bacterium]|nr:DUF2892 domain-containing protein [Bacteroidia bacterium]MDW8015740.1 DUF2892 domain-containing protein [Bacteroidia bacterium]
MKLYPNVGKTDKIIRSIIGGLLTGAGIYYSYWVLVGIGVLIALSAVIGRCGLYYLLGVNTCTLEERKESSS